MNEWLNPLVGDVVQCWGCPVFDRLMAVVSNAAAAVYGKFAIFCIVLFAGLFAMYVFYSVWKNMKGGMADPFYRKSVQPVIIAALFALTFLSMGVYVPRLVTSITFEPVAEMTLRYTQAVVGLNDDQINQRVTYVPAPMTDTGFYRPQLRDKIIMLMKTTVTQFQAYIKLGLAVMDAAFSWRALVGIGALLKHIMMFVVGLYLVYAFFKLFLRFCFYFADIIVAMTFFAFFFPLSLVTFAFRNSDAPDWMKNLGKKFGVGQFKNLINAIVALSAAVLTYTVAMVLIAKFFSSPTDDVQNLMELITTGQVMAGDLSDENLGAVTLMGAVVLVYVVNYLTSLAPEVTKMVLGAFDVTPENSISEGLANDAMQVGKNIIEATKKTVAAVSTPSTQAGQGTTAPAGASPARPAPASGGNSGGAATNTGGKK